MEQIREYYRQLFGYGWWDTLWRLAVILLLVLTTAIVAVMIIGTVYDSDQYDAFFDILIVLPLYPCVPAVASVLKKRLALIFQNPLFFTSFFRIFDFVEIT